MGSTVDSMASCNAHASLHVSHDRRLFGHWDLGGVPLVLSYPVQWWPPGVWLTQSGWWLVLNARFAKQRVKNAHGRLVSGVLLVC